MRQQTHYQKGLVIILSSPSGGGKSSLTQGLLKMNDNFRKSISVTTRGMRQGEKEGIDYYFKPTKEFQELINEKKFLEYAVIYGNLYGTLEDLALQILSNGHDLLFDIDSQGARSIREKIAGSISIFILPPDIETLRKRLEKRGQDSEEVIKRRLAEAEEEMKHAKEYDYVVTNDDFGRTLEQIHSIIITEKEKKAATG